MQEAAAACAEGTARASALQQELEEASIAREVLALALARLLRDTHRSPATLEPLAGRRGVDCDGAAAGDNAALLLHMQGLSLHGGDAAPRDRTTFIEQSVAAAHKILGITPAAPTGALLLPACLRTPCTGGISAAYTCDHAMMCSSSLCEPRACRAPTCWRRAMDGLCLPGLASVALCSLVRPISLAVGPADGVPNPRSGSVRAPTPARAAWKRVLAAADRANGTRSSRRCRHVPACAGALQQPGPSDHVRQPHVKPHPHTLEHRGLGGSAVWRTAAALAGVCG
jgi:hypothetical protein